VPMIDVVMTMLFILVTIFKSVGQENWKSSLLPLLFHHLGERPPVAPQKMFEIKAVARATEVRLEKGQSGSHFFLATSFFLNHYFYDHVIGLGFTCLGNTEYGSIRSP
jgi:hypothetical protein